MFFSNSDHSFIVIFFVKLEAYRGLILVKTVFSGHIRFFSYGLKRYWPIRLHGSSNCNREFRSRFSNADISGTKRANRNPIRFSKWPKTVLSKCPMSNLDYHHSFTPKIEAQNAVLKRDRISISRQSFKYFSRLCRRIILVFHVK